MLNMAHRHRRAARKAGAKAVERMDYVITDPHHRPDLRGEFAGAKVRKVGGKQVVALSAKQARFYLDQGVLEPLHKAAPEAKADKSAAPVKHR